MELMRLTEFRIGDRVRISSDCLDINQPDRVLHEGMIGELVRLQRIEDGCEVWEMWASSYNGGDFDISVSVTHDYIDLVPACVPE